VLSIATHLRKMRCSSLHLLEKVAFRSAGTWGFRPIGGSPAASVQLLSAARYRVAFHRKSCRQGRGKSHDLCGSVEETEEKLLGKTRV